MRPPRRHYSRPPHTASRLVHSQRDRKTLSISIAATVYESYSKASPQMLCTAFHAGLRTAGNARQIAEISYSEKQGKPETVKHETKVKTNDTGARSVIRDVHVGRRVKRLGRSGRLWTMS